jgi:alanine dehydrogenase
VTLILSNKEIEAVFTLEECFAALESALLDLGNGKAVNMPRQDLLVPGPLPGSYHGLKTSCGSLPRAQVTTVRVTSDIITWPIVDGRQRRVKVPLAAGNKFVGLVFVFSNATGELLAILPDGFVQALRVGVTNALSAKYMARPESAVLGLFGSGWQARPALLALCKILPIEEIRVYSPTKRNRERFADELGTEVKAKVFAVAEPKEAARGADVVALATNALDPFFPASWLEPGMHVTTVRPSEMTLDALLRCDLVAVSSREPARLMTLPGEETKIPEFGKGDYARSELEGTAADWSDKPELSEIMVGKSNGRQNPTDITCMLNYVGLGLQFSAVAARIYQLAKAQRIGNEVPADCFVQEEHS